MSDTVLTILKRISRKLGLDPTLSAISDNDESQWLLDRLNDRYFELKRLFPLPLTYFDKDGSLSLVAGQRLYTLATDSYLPDLYLWSLILNTSGSSMIALQFKPLSKITSADANYRTIQGQPIAVYTDQGKLGFYPVPSTAATVTYQYRQLPAKLVATTDTLLIPDTWLSYLELAVELDYQLWKGQGIPEVTLARLNQQYALIYGELNRLAPSRFKSNEG